MVRLIEKIGKILIKFYTLIHNFSISTENWVFLKILLYSKYKFLPRINNFYLQTYLLEGKERYGGKSIKVLFCGNSNSLLYLSDLLFIEKPQQNFLGNNLFKQAYKNLQEYSYSVDLTILKTDRFFLRFLQKKGFVIIPEWIAISLDISKPLKEVIKNFKKSAKEDLIKIKKNNYSYEVTTDLEKFDYFFYKIRQEYFSKRIGEQALPGSTAYHDVRCAFNGNKLFLLKIEDKYVAGFLIVEHKNNIISPHFMGIIEYPYMDQAAGSALIYLLICWAKEQKFDTINFGLTRSFLNNGSLRFKRKWGMSVKSGHKFHSIFALKFNNFENNSIYDFLENNPFIYYEKNKLTGFIFLKELEAEDKLQEVQKKYYIPGLSNIIIIQGKEKLRSLSTYFKERNNL